MPIEPSRKSRRLATSSSTSTTFPNEVAEPDNDAAPRNPPLRLRQLSPPPAPSPPSEDYPSDFIAPAPTRDSPLGGLGNEQEDLVDENGRITSIEGLGRAIRFEVETHFAPNLSPEEMIRLGSFGGTFFRYVMYLRLTSLLVGLIFDIVFSSVLPFLASCDEIYPPTLTSFPSRGIPA